MSSHLRFFAGLLCGIPILAFAQAKTVRDYGAVGDGMADDTAAIQRSVEAGSVIFPKGTYRLTKTVVIDLDHNGYTTLEGDGTARIVMAGAGPAFHFVGTHASSADPWNVKPDVWQKQRMPMVKGLEIVGENPEADGIEATGTMQLTITSVLVREARHGIHLTQRDRNVIISDCHIYNNHGCGVFLDDVNLHQTNVVGCHISYNAGGGVVTRGGQVRNLQIAGCDIESNMTPQSPPTANVLIDSTGGSTDEVAVTGCTLQHNSKSPGSANLRFIGPGIVSTEDPTTTNEGQLVVSGNLFSDVQVNIHLKHARGVTITGNSFWEGFEQNLLIEDSQAVVVGPNDFNRNPRYAVNKSNGREHDGIVLRRCLDSKVEGLLLEDVRHDPAAVLLEDCTRCTLQNCSIFDSDGIGLLLKNSTKCRVSGCLIRDDRPEKNPQPSFKQDGGSDNWVSDNWLANGSEGLDEAAARANRK